MEKFEEYKMDNGRTLNIGTEFSVKGERGRFRFIEYVVAPKGEWITGYGGAGWRDKGIRSYRSFSPSRIKMVHNKNKIR